MKKLIFSTLALCLLMSSCSNNELLNSQIGDTETPQVQISEETPAMRKARAAAFVRQNPAIFGTNVRIFDSYDELDSTLAVLQDMDYKQLRQWTNENNVENEILESNIIYEQEWEKAWELIEAKPYPGGSINLHAAFPPGYGNVFVSPAEKALDQFVKTMQEKYPQYILEYDSLGEHYIESLGLVDEMVFCNSNNLFVVGEEVHRFFGKDEVLCSTTNYSKIAQMKNIMEVKQLQNQAQASGG
ncbi:MAG: fimbrillin family protein [Paludibacteraceae bacterium]|nr:fimbrillin family protein [Paludibacteraceae bacterium]